MVETRLRSCDFVFRQRTLTNDRLRGLGSGQRARRESGLTQTSSEVQHDSGSVRLPGVCMANES